MRREIVAPDRLSKIELHEAVAVAKRPLEGLAAVRVDVSLHDPRGVRDGFGRSRVRKRLGFGNAVERAPERVGPAFALLDEGEHAQKNQCDDEKKTFHGWLRLHGGFLVMRSERLE